MKQRYTIVRYEYEVDYENSDAILIDSYFTAGDLLVAVNALQSDCWDHRDIREKTVILHPSDYHTDFRTGKVTYTDIAITADKPENLQRLLGWLDSHK